MRRFLSILLALGLVLSFSLLTAVPVLAFTEVWVDDVTDPAEDGSQAHPFDSIQEAISYIAGIPDDGTVHVLEGTYYEDITLNNGVDVLGAGADDSIIHGSGLDTVVTAGGSVSSGTVFDGFTITNGLQNYGGGMNINGSSLTVSNCVFLNNEAANRGGGMYIINSASPVVANCIFANNAANNFTGGGIYSDATSSPSIINNTIVGNTANTSGGGIYFVNLSTTITNNIIYDNEATTAGGGIYCNNASSPTLEYNDVFGNTAPTGADYYGCSAGTGAISVDPVFDDAQYHIIYPDSPCIDMGNNSAPSLPSTDFEGEPRIFDGDIVPGAVVDMGADEYYVAPPPPPPPRGPVGGEVYPIDKAALLLPWLGLSIVLILAAGGLIIIRRQAK
jgi:parallel beta-helix repeat protein/predicted outer membrane repeat protein